jgi:hypothetical protein
MGWFSWGDNNRVPEKDEVCLVDLPDEGKNEKGWGKLASKHPAIVDSVDESNGVARVIGCTSSKKNGEIPIKTTGNMPKDPTYAQVSQGLREVTADKVLKSYNVKCTNTDELKRNLK